MNKFNVFQNSKRVEGEHNDKSDFISDGYIKLDKEKNYFVFIYKTTPDWQQEGTLYEARAPQIGVAADDSEANIFIKTQRNGGGFLQSYIRLDGASTTDNVVVADTIGRIAGLNTADFNDLVTFHVEELLVTDNNDANYPASMTAWLGNDDPVFAKPSTNPDEEEPDGMSINHVPYDVVGFIGYAYPPSAPYIDYANGDGSTSFTSDNIVKAWDVGTLYGYTANPIVSGLLNYNDLTIVPHNDAPANEIIYFDNTEIDIIATSQTSITTVGAMTDEGTGFVYTDCYRQDIAYIKWDAPLNRFQIYQLQYGPIKLRQNPLGSFKNKLLTAEEIAEWSAGFDLCQYITGSFGGYTKDLNQSTSGTQPPVYAGYENIGNYQSPKETL
jgi:hypothetical protein